jgi:hypothetical protein
MRPSIPGLVAWLVLATGASAEVFSYVDVPLPEAVAAQTECADDGQPYPTRRPFAGGYVFAIRCPGNNANYIQALVRAADETGADARLLLFPAPPGNEDGPLDALSNIQWFAETAEVTHLFVNPEETICRYEGRWRVETGEPTLVFWRQTEDCDGNGGWQLLVDPAR